MERVGDWACILRIFLKEIFKILSRDLMERSITPAQKGKKGFPGSGRKVFGHFHGAIRSQGGGDVRGANGKKNHSGDWPDEGVSEKGARISREKERNWEAEAPPVATPSPNHSLNVHKQVSGLADGGWCMTYVIPEPTKFPSFIPASHPLFSIPFCSYEWPETRNRKTGEAETKKDERYRRERERTRWGWNEEKTRKLVV